MNVDQVSGSFQFNQVILSIPGPNGGYPLTISYRSDNNQTSWVGRGWTLSPGAVTRSVNGFYDDAMAQPVKVWNKTIPNITVTSGPSVGGEAFGLGVHYSPYVAFNSMKGFSTGYGLGANLLAFGLNFSSKDKELEYSMQVDPAMLLNVASHVLRYLDNARLSDVQNPLRKATRLASVALMMAGKVAQYNGGTRYHMIDRSHFGFYPPQSSYTGQSFSGNVQVQFDAGPIPIGIDGGVNLSWTKQETLPSQNFLAFGYNYSHEAKNPVTDLMDYTLDTNEANGFVGRETKFLPQIVAGADNFHVAADGLSGSFRAYNTQLGTFGPNKTSSITYLNNAGVDVHVGSDLGLGASGGIGTSTEVDGPIEDVALEDFTFAPFRSISELGDAENERGVFYWLHGDAAPITYGGDQQSALRASLQKDGNGYDVKMPSDFSGEVKNGNQLFGTSTIRVFTNKDYAMTLPLATGDALPYAPALVDIDLEKQLLRLNETQTAIAGIEMVSSSGVTYAFHRPLHTRNEMELSVNAFPFASIESPVGPLILKNIFAPDFLAEDQIVISGHESNAPYATSFLLTGIASDQYVDLTNDGFTVDDVGAIAKFHYTKPSYFRYRFPERGLFYVPRALSDKKDDLASFSSGEVEVAFLEKIETSTHVAIFHTSKSDRLEAISNEIADDLSLDVPEPIAGRKAYQRLDKIELFLKQSDGGLVLLETTYFEYANGPRDAEYLLKRFWKEKADIRDSRIQAMEFDYTYKSEAEYDLQIRERYPDIVSYGKNLNQQPTHELLNMDTWGNYQKNGKTRQGNGITWIDQTPDVDFDPAAWKVKTVHFPSGAQVVVQYEQSDYAMVQDQPARVTVPLQAAEDPFFKYYLNLSEVGIMPDQYDAYKAYLDRVVVDKKEPLPYKMLFSMLTNVVPDFDKCDSEYVTGFTTISEVNYDDQGFYVVPSDIENNPRHVCIEMVKVERGGMIVTGQGSDCYDQVLFGLGQEPTMESFNKFAVSTAQQLKNKWEVIKAFPPADFCRKLNSTLSYIDLPVLQKKFGGGVRVKRLLTYDHGIETGTATLYGNEFKYLTEKGGVAISSGVASNEPGGDNSLRTLLDTEGGGHAAYSDPLTKKRFWGDARLRRLGPLMSSALPSPSIYYGRVISSNISPDHPAYTINDYYTNADFPVIVSYTDMLKKLKVIPPVSTLGFYALFDQWTVQGFTTSFIDGVGLPLSSKTFSGVYGDEITDLQFAATVHEYFDDQVPVLKYDDKIEWATLGSTSETISFGRQSKKKYVNGGLFVDFTVGFAFPMIIPYPIPGGYLNVAEEKFSMLSTCTINSRKLYQKSVTSITDGVVQKIENLAFDPLTGEPVLQRTADGYDDVTFPGTSAHNGSISTRIIPGHRIYDGLAAKSENEGFNLKTAYDEVILEKDNNEYYLNLASTANDLAPCEIRESRKVKPGDLIQVSLAGVNEVYSVSDEIIDGSVKLYALDGVDASAYQLIPDGISHVDAYVVRSGNSNQLNAQAGIISYYGKLLDPVSSQKLSAAHQVAQMLTDAASTHGDVTTLSGNRWPSGIEISFGATCFSISGLTIEVTVGDELDFNCRADAFNVVITLKVPAGTIFEVDHASGNLRYYVPGQEHCPQSITCFRFCIDEEFKKTQHGVLSATANVYSRDTEVTLINNGGVMGANPFQNGRKYLRAKSAHQFSTNQIVSGTNHSAGERNYDAGTFELSHFNYDNPILNKANGWIKGREIQAFSQSGKPLVTANTLGIRSVVKTYPTTQLPFLSATNAEENNVFFEPFEPVSVLYNMDLAVYETPFSPFVISGISNATDTQVAHTGKSSLRIFAPAGSNFSELQWDPGEGLFDQTLLNSGFTVKAWVNASDQFLEGKVNLILENGQKIPFKVKSESLDWRLIEAVVSPQIISGAFQLGDPLLKAIRFEAINGGNVWIDDVMVKSFDTSIQAVIYDEHLRPSAIFDDRGYSLRYTYAPNGTLSRKSIETEYGLKPIEERRVHYKGTDRD